MSTERLIDVLTEMRDQQRKQVENFERALAAQTAQLELQRKSRPLFQFMVCAPWVALIGVLVYLLLASEILR